MRLLAALALVMLAVAAAAFLFWRFASVGACDDRVVTETSSPDGRFVATSFERRCGSAGRVTTQVALRATGSRFAPDTGSTVFIAADRPEVRLLWREPRTLVVETAAVEVLVEKPSWRNVAIVLRRLR